jgi:hypothetical protein
MDNSGCGGTDLIKLMTTEKDTNGIDASSFPVFLATSDVDRLLDNPEIRRARLLSKALEDLPLSKALELARVAERFLCRGPSESRGTTEVFSRPDAAKPVALPATTPVAISNGTGIEDHGRRSADILDFVVLAPIDDITRYLGQHGDLIVSKGDLFVVDGQSVVTLDELLARANRLRVRQGLPTYAPLPAALVVAAPKKAEPRPPKPPQPPCRKEREHWARQVMEP